jgi:hypothetical protein
MRPWWALQAELFWTSIFLYAAVYVLWGLHVTAIVVLISESYSNIQTNYRMHRKEKAERTVP